MIVNDILYIISWWFLYLIAGFISLPLTWYFLRHLFDVGYGFAKTLGFLILSFLVFLFGIFKLLPFTNSTIYILALVLVFINAWIFQKNKKEIRNILYKKKKVIVFQEFLFLLGFSFWTLVRSHQPDIKGLEKFMDFGFINSILRTKYFPPPDMWLSGHTINYYWFGHLWTAISTKLSNIPSHVTYNLMIATILGLILTSAFSISTSLINSIKSKINIKTVFATGIISALLLVFGGNFHAPIYIIKDGAENYWYPDATRFIGFHPETNDKTIHEFPIYSFVVSDLHAHLINLPFVLLFIAFLTGLIMKNDKRNLISASFVLGIMFMTNTWDYANYLLVFGVSLGLYCFIKKGINHKTILKISTQFLLILLISLLFAAPFILNFNSITEGVKFVNNHSPLWQLAVLWGFPAILSFFYLVLFIKNRKRLQSADIFVFTLLISAWMLIIIPEILYVKDIYISSHHRANTMFKLTYQSFVLFYLLSGYLSIRSLLLVKTKIIKNILTIFYMIIFSSVLIYPSFAINSYYGELKQYRGLSGRQWIKNKYPHEYEIINWFEDNIKGQPIILEAPGDSYTENNLISSYTGLPTVSGWYVHEWLWRGTSQIPQERASDIKNIYTSGDLSLTKELISQYKVNYIIIGVLEREKYPDLNENKFEILGEKVFSSNKSAIYLLSY